ncbi:MAG: hypothetical protein RLZZ613_1586, partial [Pseudomonadota bacterium]
LEPALESRRVSLQWPPYPDAGAYALGLAEILTKQSSGLHLPTRLIRA